MEVKEREGERECYRNWAWLSKGYQSIRDTYDVGTVHGLYVGNSYSHMNIHI